MVKSHQEPEEYRERMDRLRVLISLRDDGSFLMYLVGLRTPWVFSHGWVDNSAYHEMFVTFEELETCVNGHASRG